MPLATSGDLLYECGECGESPTFGHIDDDGEWRCNNCGEAFLAEEAQVEEGTQEAEAVKIGSEAEAELDHHGLALPLVPLSTNSKLGNFASATYAGKKPLAVCPIKTADADAAASACAASVAVDMQSIDKTAPEPVREQRGAAAGEEADDQQGIPNIAIRFIAKFHGCSFPGFSTKKGRVGLSGPISLKLSNIPGFFSHEACGDFIRTYGFNGDYQSIRVPGYIGKSGFHNFGYALFKFADPESAVKFTSMFEGCKYPFSDQTGCVQIPSTLDESLPLTGHPLENSLLLSGIPCAFSRDMLIGFIERLGFIGEYVSESLRLPSNMNKTRNEKYNKGYAYCKFNTPNIAIRFIAKFHGCSFPGRSTKRGRVVFDGLMQNFCLKLLNIPISFSREACIGFIRSHGFTGDYQSIFVPGFIGQTGFRNFGYAAITFEDPESAVNFISMFDGCKYPLSDQTGCVQIL